jgi:dihydropyrimidine dehydrogenase (NAD+) subunit PreA
MLKIREEAARCMLCGNAKCTLVCPKGYDPARAVRAVRFENENIAGSFVDTAVCAECDGVCEKACIHYDRPIRFREQFQTLPKAENETNDAKPSLAIDFCGIHCENPFFLASSAVCTNYDMVARA